MLSELSLIHFQEPRWLLALIPLVIILWLVARSRPNMSSWSNVIDSNLLPYLLQGKESKVSKLPKWLLAVGGLLVVIALADPVWEKIPRPVFQTNSARVIVLDLSSSMMINDLKPSRLARARFKIEDILSRDEEGQIGMVVFAGDAFTASPLTRDVDTIRNLLQVFTPRIMPSQGSRVDYGLQKALELLKQANVQNGQVLLIADGVSNPAAAGKAAKALKDAGHTVSVLAVGTEKGGLLRLRTKRIRVKLDVSNLQKVSKTGGGGYHIITSNNTDLNTVLKRVVNNKQKQTQTNDFKSDDWKSTGPYLLLLLLPLAALAFRKGWLLNVFITLGLLGMLSQPSSIHAEEAKSFTTSLNSQWQKLWLNNEQRADNAFKQKQFDQATQLSDTPLRKGSAAYKNNDYKSALDSFQKAQGADARYNEGNALAKLKKYKEAIEAYNKTLKINPNMKDAKANKKALEDFLKKQKEKEKKNSKQNKDQKDNKDKQQDKDKKNKKKGDKGKKQKDKKSGEKDKGKKDGDKENQFADANKDLDKDKESDQEDKKKQDQQDQQDQQKKAGKDKGKGSDKKNKSDKEKQEEAKQKQAKKKTEQEKKEEALKAAKADELTKEEKMAAEQWLRRIPDDPGGLLRRKFRRQYQRSNRRPNDDEKPW